MKKILFVLLLAALPVSSAASGQPAQVPVQVPINNIVADETTAIRIAEAILAPIYGERILAKQRPLIANLVGDVWQINGTMRPFAFGARIHVEISKRDGRILQVTLGQHHDSAL
jgi:hypothetical protein